MSKPLSLAEQLVERGVRAVVVAGTTGEAAFLDPDERSKLLAAVRGAVSVRSGVAAIAGTGAPSASQRSGSAQMARPESSPCPHPGVATCIPNYDEVVAAVSGLPVLAYPLPRGVVTGHRCGRSPRPTGGRGQGRVRIPLTACSRQSPPGTGPSTLGRWPCSPLPSRSRRPAPPPSVVTSGRSGSSPVPMPGSARTSHTASTISPRSASAPRSRLAWDDWRGDP